MNEVIVSILSGGFAGAGVVVFLGKLLLNHQFNKASQKHQHDLDLKKKSIQTDLSIYANQQMLNLSKHSESERIALENIYGAVVSTSFPRLGFQPFPSVERAKKDASLFQKEYFNAFKKTFNSFEFAYKKIQKAFETLEENAIYIENESEIITNTTLQEILKLYNNRDALLKEGYSNAERLFYEEKLTFESMPFDFVTFYNTSVSEWINATNTVRVKLKEHVKSLLFPGENRNT